MPPTGNFHFNEPSGHNDTILPHDARNPQETLPTEILDEEFNVIIENARAAHGVNVITIFDSCHSATGTRGVGDGQPRQILVRTVPAADGKIEIVSGIEAGMSILAP